MRTNAFSAWDWVLAESLRCWKSESTTDERQDILDPDINKRQIIAMSLNALILRESFSAMSGGEIIDIQTGSVR